MSKNFTDGDRAETSVYTTLTCCSSTCVVKAHIKEGVVVTVEPDDRYNTGIGREDEVLSERRQACHRQSTCKWI